MKKILEAELISLAHRVLKLKNRSETIQLQQETQKLYEQLTMLRFFEENEQRLNGEIQQEAFIAAVESHTIHAEKETATKEETVVEVEKSPEPVLKEVIAEEPILLEKEELENEELIEQEEVQTQEEVIAEKGEIEDNPVVTPQEEVQYQDMFAADFEDLDFVKVEDIAPETIAATGLLFDAVEVNPEQPKTETVAQPEAEKAPKSINDKFNKGINIGLNDRIAFEKRLFNGSADDFNRVLSQLNSLESYQEVHSFINDFVKPDYNNWNGLEEYETRFLEIVEKKFN